MLAGKALNLDTEQTRTLGLGALLSATGLRKLPQALRTKLEPLTENERREFERYPELGKDVLVALGNVPESVVDLVWKHRECLDGSGYPRGLSGGDVPLLARLLGASLEYNALIAGSQQREGKSPAAALSILFTRFKDKLGHDAITPMILALTVYPPGSFVKMSDGSVGIVVKVNPEARLRPTVLVTEDGNTMAIDLNANKSLAIRETLERGDVHIDLVESLDAAFDRDNFGLLDDA
jgi:HD-GYP domain-containing protein (c-di-GMP phosphodiesterase class II)